MSDAGVRATLAMILATCIACGSYAPQPMTQRRFALEEAESALWPGETQAVYRVPTEEQRRALDALISKLWDGVAPGPADELRALADRAGMTLELWTIGDRVTWVVREPAGAQYGRGSYLVNAAPRPRRPILLQAPHVYFDRRTQSIAAAMYWAADARPELHGLFTNSIHRFQHEGTERKKRRFNPADVAHNSEHPYQTATAAVLELGPVVVLQLHGFDGDYVGSKVSAIVSAAKPEGSTPESAIVALTLAETAGIKVSKYPEDIKALGGLDNVQGRLVSGSPSARFVHVELELSVRKRLRDPALASTWARAFITRLSALSTP